MKQEKIVELAKHLGEVPRYVGFRNADRQLNIGGYESAAFETPGEAFAEAKRDADAAGYTRLDYGVRAKIGQDVVVTEVDGFTGRT